MDLMRCASSSPSSRISPTLSREREDRLDVVTRPRPGRAVRCVPQKLPANARSILKPQKYSHTYRVFYHVSPCCQRQRSSRQFAYSQFTQSVVVGRSPEHVRTHKLRKMEGSTTKSDGMGSARHSQAYQLGRLFLPSITGFSRGDLRQNGWKWKTGRGVQPLLDWGLTPGRLVGPEGEDVRVSAR